MTLEENLVHMGGKNYEFYYGINSASSLPPSLSLGRAGVVPKLVEFLGRSEK